MPHPSLMAALCQEVPDGQIGCWLQPLRTPNLHSCELLGSRRMRLASEIMFVEIYVSFLNRILLYLHNIFGKKMHQLVGVGGVCIISLSLPVGFLPVSPPRTSSLLNLLSSADYALSSNSAGPPPLWHRPVFAASFRTSFCLCASVLAGSISSTLYFPFSHLILSAILTNLLLETFHKDLH